MAFMDDPFAWTKQLDARLHSVRCSGTSTGLTTWIPYAWRALADESHEYAVPERPRLIWDSSLDVSLGFHEELVPWWLPLLHLTIFGLGWSRIDRGLYRWREMGKPTNDPILRLIDRWYGRHIEDYLAKAATPRVESALTAWNPFAEAQWISDLGLPPPSDDALPIADDFADFRDSEHWERIWVGGTDPMHFTLHATTPLWEAPPATTAFSPPASPGMPRAAIFNSEYEGWYRNLLLSGLGESRPGMSWRIDVVCTPLGYLGEYRRSRKTGLHFRGQHRWHQLGQ